jgi:hypothetical protein
LFFVSELESAIMGAQHDFPAGWRTMSIRQLSIFVENRAGAIAEVAGSLADNEVNIFGFALADTGEYAIVRLVVDKVDLAQTVLSQAGFVAIDNDVLCVEVPPGPGSLATLARTVTGAGADIEYLYLGAGESVVVKAHNAEGLEELLAGKGFRILQEVDLSQTARTVSDT